MKDIPFRKAEYGKQERTPARKVDGFDPRDDDDQRMLVGTREIFLSTLQTDHPDSGVLYFYDRVPLKAGMPSYDLKVAEQLLIYDGKSDAPASAEFLDGLPLTDPLVVESIMSTRDALVCSEEQAACAERVSRDQANCTVWYQLRNGRITSSNFSKVFTRKPSTPPENLLKQLMGYGGHKSLSSPAINWGKKFEKTAQRAYVAAQRQQGHPGLFVSTSGLNIMVSHPYLAASTDGKVTDPSSEPAHGVLEIKCPYSINFTNITSLKPAEIAAQFPGKFCLVVVNGKAMLDRKHPYYVQVHGEMAVCNVVWCDFVLWTKAGIFVERIHFDMQFWKSVFASLNNFFDHALLPEIVLRRVQRGLKLDGSGVVDATDD